MRVLYNNLPYDFYRLHIVKITIAGASYVGLSNAMQFALHNDVVLS